MSTGLAEHFFVNFLKSRGFWLAQTQKPTPWSEIIDLTRKAYDNETRPWYRWKYLHQLRAHEAQRDFDAGSIRQIDHLIQIDPTPNLELKEARCEIYKISVSFESKREFHEFSITVINISYFT